jgi:cytochrome c-type biogenesis protein CcmH/NrfG
MDLRRVLDLEPKHFRALGLLGSIFRELNDPKSALEAYEAAVTINPHMEGGAAAVRQLTDEVKGRGI